MVKIWLKISDRKMKHRYMSKRYGKRDLSNNSRDTKKIKNHMFCLANYVYLHMGICNGLRNSYDCIDTILAENFLILLETVTTKFRYHNKKRLMVLEYDFCLDFVQKLKNKVKHENIPQISQSIISRLDKVSFDILIKTLNY